MSRVGGSHSVVLSPPAPARDAPPPVNAIVVYAGLQCDARTIADKLKTLGVDSTGVHGDLQVILSALRRMQAGVKALIEIEEGA